MGIDKKGQRNAVFGPDLAPRSLGERVRSHSRMARERVGETFWVVSGLVGESGVA